MNNDEKTFIGIHVLAFHYLISLLRSGAARFISLGFVVGLDVIRRRVPTPHWNAGPPVCCLNPDD